MFLIGAILSLYGRYVSRDKELYLLKVTLKQYGHKSKNLESLISEERYNKQSVLLGFICFLISISILYRQGMPILNGVSFFVMFIIFCVIPHKWVLKRRMRLHTTVDLVNREIYEIGNLNGKIYYGGNIKVDYMWAVKLLFTGGLPEGMR